MSGPRVGAASDSNHCGACDRACTTATIVCAAGTCAVDCPGDLRRCGDACVETDAHPRYCGSCGTRCRADEVCLDGRCEDYLAAPECADCPCDACRDYRCARYPGTTTVICL